jgi:hypothetical protein
VALGDKYPVVYVDGDVPQLPIQLGQLLVDSSQISVGNTNLQQCTSQVPLVYEPIQGGYPITPAEVIAGVTIVNDHYPESCPDRYANNTVPGTTDMRAAWMAAYTVWRAGGRSMSANGTYRLNPDGANTYSLLWNDDILIDGAGAVTLIGNGSGEYTLLYINGGTNVTIRIAGITFDGALVGYTPASSNSIGIRLGSSISSIDIDTCRLTRFSGDAIYSSATVNGIGGSIHDITIDDVGRSAVTLAVGDKIALKNIRTKDVQIQPFSLLATNSAAVLRNIDVIDCHVDGGGNYSVAPYHNIDRAGIAVIGQPGAAATDQCNIRVIGGSVRNFGMSAAGTVPLVLGIETRDIKRPIVQGLLVDTVRNIGLYSYRTDGAVYADNEAYGCDIGLNMNDCDNYSEMDNTCLGNTTSQKSYFGVDGATSYIRADGMNETMARGSMTFPAGVPTLAAGAFNVAVDLDAGTGNTRFVFTRGANSARYSVEVTLNGSSAATGTYRTSSLTSAKFNVETFTAGVAADEPYTFVVTGMYTGTVEP